MMNALELDFCRAKPASPWAGWLLLAVALVFIGDLALSYRDLRASIASSEARLAELGGPAAAARRAAARPQTAAPEEIAFARETIARLSMPWSSLFGALESVPAENVALLAIEPDRESGTVLISGEAKTYVAVLNYVQALRRARPLRDVHLAKHEARENAGPNPVAFSVSARWKESQP
ncbi:MAG: hypothetical protein A3G27_03255 [Betaproteobacteria bacterium RIFCSPLOWO2_12_FULL_66_14]|nr:MAG: hypothetical protein A3G27_03255 [Betaproteobacteria bacterium RIFCSPLOWO2_12_FULL_66_14]